MFQIKASNQLLSGQFKGLLCNFAQFIIMLDNVLDVNFEFCVHLLWTHACLGRHFLDDVNYFSEDLRAAFLHKCHEVLDFLFFGLVDDHSVALLHEEVELLSELAVVEESVIDFDEAIVLIFGLLILPEEFGNVFVGLEVFGFEFFEPFFGLFDADLLHREKWFKL
jgi:hypothetical protein